MRRKRPSVGSLSMQNYPNKSAGTVFINPAPPVPAPPVNIEAPLLSGTGAVESTVTCSSGVWTGSPTPTYTYIFYVDGIEEQNSSSNEFFVHETYDGLTITAEVTATNTEGSATEPASNSIVVGTIPVNTVEPTLSPSGIQSTGTLITINERTWDGTPPLTFEYRWLRDGIVIDGEDGKTYTIAIEDDGTVITAEVRASNAYGVSIWVLTSNQVDAVNAVAPSNVTSPVISGSTSLGSVLSTTNGTWSGTPATFSYTYQWKRNGSPIVGGTASTYTTVVADSTANITCDVTADNGVAPTATAGSNTLTMANYTPANTVAPSVTGTAVVGQTLSTTNGTWTNSPSSFSYQWYRGATPIGTNSASYTLVQADAGQNIKCTVTATNSAGSASADSNTVAIYSSLLDLVGSAQIAYDLRLVRGAQLSLPILKVRSSTANAEGELYFNSSYVVGMNSNVVVTAAGTSGLSVSQTVSLTTFVNSGGSNQSAAVITFYDQSGNAYNATQTDPTKQALIVSVGSLVVGPTTGKPSLLFDGTNDSYDINATYAISSTTAFSNVFVARPETPNQYQTVLSQKSNLTGFMNFFSNQTGYTDFQIGSQANFARTRYVGAPYGAVRLINAYYNGSGAGTAGNYSCKINNASASQLSGGNMAASNNTSKLGSDNNTSYFKGYFMVAYSWNANQTANESIINGNVNAYYGLY
jgi:hypothetical protein